MRTRKKIVNSHEAVARQILATSAARNSATAYPKMRIADVLPIEHSGLDNTLYSFALKGHFDFIVVDESEEALFAVEYDGPSHEQPRGIEADLKKNRIAEFFNLPLARVRDEHIFRKARGINYLTWLTEVFFWFQALVAAQESGIIPPDEPLDPMLVLTHPHVRGTFPLFLSGPARVKLQQWHEDGRLPSAFPFHLSGYDDLGRCHCLTLLPSGSGEILSAHSAIYVSGFGVAPSEAADEIAAVSLAEFAKQHLEKGDCAVPLRLVRYRLIEFLRAMRVASWGGSLSNDWGFSLGFSQSGWTVGAYGTDPEVNLPLRKGAERPRDTATTS